jgi:hypothetical protein
MKTAFAEHRCRSGLSTRSALARTNPPVAFTGCVLRKQLVNQTRALGERQGRSTGRERVASDLRRFGSRLFGIVKTVTPARLKAPVWAAQSGIIYCGSCQAAQTKEDQRAGKRAQFPLQPNSSSSGPPTKPISSIT